MTDPLPIACTLTTDQLQDRGAEWRALRRYVDQGTIVPGGLSITFKMLDGVEPELQRLIALEAECCRWMTFAVRRGQGGLEITITADGEDGQRAAREMFAYLIA